MNNKLRTKFNVNKNAYERTYEGIVFDSVLEMKYYRDILLPALANGEIKVCERQKTYILQPAYKHKGKTIQPIKYCADFYVVDKFDNEIVIDIKGCPDSSALLKRKMFWYTFPKLEYVWLGYSRLDGGWTTYENIKQGRAQRKKDKKEKLSKNDKKESK